MRGWTILTVTFLIGVAGGAATARFLPSLAAVYMPVGLGAHTHVADVVITKKEREQDRLLLRVQAAERPLLVTFTKRVAEIDLLVEPGDVVTTALPDNQTFVEDPPIERVRRPSGSVPAATPSERGNN